MIEMIKDIDAHLINTYKRYQIIFDHASDVYLYDINNKKYLDFGGGIAVCALGYSNDAY